MFFSISNYYLHLRKLGYIQDNCLNTITIFWFLLFLNLLDKACYSLCFPLPELKILTEIKR